MEEIVTRRGTGFGKVMMELKADRESKNSREPKCDEALAAEEARMADMQGESRVGRAGEAVAVQRTMS